MIKILQTSILKSKRSLIATIALCASLPIQAQTISTNPLPLGAYCAGSTLTVTATPSSPISGTFNAELSDNSGSFSSPTVIGTSSSVNSISATIPNTILDGANYRIRVVRTIPSNITGSDNGSDIQLNTSVPSFVNCSQTVTGNTTSSGCENAVTYIKTSQIPYTGSFTMSGATVGTGSGSGSGSAVFNKGTTTVQYTAGNGCGTSVCTFPVVISDATNPTIACGTAANISTSPNLCSGATTLQAPSFSDNCGLSNGLKFDGANDYISFSSDLSSVTDFTYEAWVYVNQFGSWDRIFDFGNAPGDNAFLTITTGTNKYPRFAINVNNTGEQRISSGTQLTTGTWTHIAVTVDATNHIGTMYLNGVQVGQNTNFTYTPSSIGATTRNWIGRSQYNLDSYFNGILDEVRIWNVARTQAQIQANINQELAAQSGLLAVYHLNQGVPDNVNTGINTATDASGNAITGTLNNFALTGSSSNWTVGKDGVAITNNAPITYPIGSTTVTWTATDGSGNTSTCTQAVNVTDNQAPVVTCPSPVTLNTVTGTCAAPFTILDPIADNCTNATWSAVFSGNANGNPANTSSIADGSNSSAISFNKGITTVTLSGTDGSNAATSCAFTVTVNDNEAPVVTCPSPVTLNTVTGTCAAPFTILDPIADNCTNATWSAAFSGNSNGNPANTSSIADGSNSSAISFNKGTTTVSLSGTDGSNAATGCSFTVTVEDHEPPIIVAPAPVVLNGYCSPGAPASAVTLGTPAVTENCSGTVTISNNAPLSYPVGTTVVTWTAQDANGNTSTATQNVTVNDLVLTLNTSVTPAYPLSGQEIQTIYLGYPGCATSETITTTPTNGSNPYTYSWTKTDCANNTTSLSNTSNSLVFTPTVADTCIFNGDNVHYFNITVTDAHNCSTVKTIGINVVNPYVGNIGNSNVLVCHKMRTRGRIVNQVLSLAPNQLATHLNHGDDLGNCGTFMGKQMAPEGVLQEVVVYPNPTTGTFIVEISRISQEADITISDIQGRTIAHKVLGQNEASTATFDLTNNAAGLYIVTVRDGEFSYAAKLILK